MIPKETVDLIIETARIDEVVGEFVALKKRGASLIGLCPFHNEKTPSFNVSPSKGIYKCFGCGKAGSSIGFLMEHDHISYPEALKWLAKKYNIEIKEQERTDDQIRVDNERESLFIINSFAQKYYTDTLLNTESGKAIGLSYFKERGFTEETINKFQLGYSTDSWNGLTSEAFKSGHTANYLTKTGLSIQKDGSDPNDISSYFDRFRGRIIFPICNATGRVIGFGGRVMIDDKKQAKYVNSPESDIYHKSQVLYGIHLAKKSIIQNDTCYLVEGYTDVISMHQAGVENVVSSSGTSLTIDQIRIIRRLTKNIVILYDGDPAGIKASFRGIDLALQEDMNVRVALFPDNEDPDSYSRKYGGASLKKFLNESTQDFISFKASILHKEIGGDPLKKASLIHDIVSSISVIPDAITRMVYVKECAKLLDVEEQTLISEVDKKRNASASKEAPRNSKPNSFQKFAESFQNGMTATSSGNNKDQPSKPIEKSILGILLIDGSVSAPMNTIDENGNTIQSIGHLCDYIITEIEHDQYPFAHPAYRLIMDEYIENYQNGVIMSVDDFTNHENDEVRSAAVDILSDFPFSKADRTGIDSELSKSIVNASTVAIRMLNIDRINNMIEQLSNDLKDADNEQSGEIIAKISSLLTARTKLSKQAGRTILK